MGTKQVFWCVVLVGLAAGAAGAAEPIVIAHRGASGYLPEHTLEAYALAYGMGADYIEPDLVLTKDNHFIALHDIHLESTTDVEEVFPDRHRDDGKWYAADFTLEEIRRLAVHERLKGRFPVGKSIFRVPAFEEMIELIQGLNATTGRSVGIYPELKQPAWHDSEGLPMEKKALAVLKAYGYEGKSALVYVQCFEPDPLRKLRDELKSELPLIQLISGNRAQREMVTEAGLKAIAEYADGIGPDKRLVEESPDIVKWAHSAGLKVHPYTVRADDVPARYPDVEAEYKALFGEFKVDGLFTDHPDQGVRAR